METKMTLFPGGTARQEIDLMTFEFPGDLKTTALLVSDTNLSETMATLDSDMNKVIAAVRNGEQPPISVFVPDLWHYRSLIPKGEADDMWRCVGIAVHIARHVYTDEDPLARNDHAIRGNTFQNPRD